MRALLVVVFIFASSVATTSGVSDAAEEMARKDFAAQSETTNGRRRASSIHQSTRQARVQEREDKLKKMADEEFGKAKKLAKNAASRKITNTELDTDEEDAHVPLSFPERHVEDLKADFEMDMLKAEEEIERKMKELEDELQSNAGSFSIIDRDEDLDLDIEAHMERLTLESVSSIDELDLDPEADRDPGLDFEHYFDEEIEKALKGHELPNIEDIQPDIPDVDNDVLFKDADLLPPEPADIVPLDFTDVVPELEEPDSASEDAFQASQRAHAE
jgi:hypothetical protein